MSEVEGPGGFGKNVAMKKNKAFHEWEEERVPNANMRFAVKHVATAAEAAAGVAVLHTHVVTAGEQLRLIHLRCWAKLVNAFSQFVIRQTGGTGHGLPAGLVDIPITYPPNYPESLKQGTYENPIHILEGTVTFEVQDPVAGVEYGMSGWGDENSPQLVYSE